MLYKLGMNVSILQKSDVHSTYAMGKHSPIECLKENYEMFFTESPRKQNAKREVEQTMVFKAQGAQRRQLLTGEVMTNRSGASGRKTRRISIKSCDNVTIALSSI